MAWLSFVSTFCILIFFLYRAISYNQSLNSDRYRSAFLGFGWSLDGFARFADDGKAKGPSVGPLPLPRRAPCPQPGPRSPGKRGGTGHAAPHLSSSQLPTLPPVHPRIPPMHPIPHPGCAVARALPGAERRCGLCSGRGARAWARARAGGLAAHLRAGPGSAAGLRGPSTWATALSPKEPSAPHKMSSRTRRAGNPWGNRSSARSRHSGFSSSSPPAPACASG